MGGKGKREKRSSEPEAMVPRLDSTAEPTLTLVLTDGRQNKGKQRRDAQVRANDSSFLRGTIRVVYPCHPLPRFLSTLGKGRRIVIASALAVLLAANANAGDLSPQEARGKQIYSHGTSPRGESITATLGASATRLPGAAAACAGCHGADGRGRPEAGVIPSDITWDHLLKSYGHNHPMGRRHPAFTEQSLKQVIRSGQDPAGNMLDTSMPVYAMSDSDLDDLLVYLRRLATDFDPGLSPTHLRIGTILPAGGRMTAIGQGVREVLGAHFDQLNAQGGIHGRRLELVETTYDDAKVSPFAAAESLLGSGNVFAILSPVVAGADAEIGALVETRRMPVIAPLTLLSPDPFSLNDFTFYLYSGMRDQARILVDFAARELRLEDPRVAILSPRSGRTRSVLEASTQQRAIHGWTRPAIERVTGDADARATATRLAAEHVSALFVLDPEELPALLAAGEAIGWRPFVLMPGSFAKPEILELPAAFQNRIYLSYATVPSDITHAGAAEFQALLKGRALQVRHRTSQVSALAAAKILTAGLKAAGRELSREKLIRSLEQLHELETGLTPAITYGANRHIGAFGAHIVTVDLENKAFVPAGGWLTPHGEL